MIIFNQVSKIFNDDQKALDDVSFQINGGEMTLITGPSGSGKTTLMRLMTKEYLPTSGDIEFEGTQLSKIKNHLVHLLRRRIGVVFQDYKLLPELNIWENIALPLYILEKKEYEIEERVTDLLNLIELPEKAFLFPSQLSGGEAQRISIARALASAPAVIFADEPTGNLDKDTSIRIAELLKKINELGTTVMFATHDTNVLEQLGNMRIITLNQGKLVEDTGAKKTEDEKTKNTNKKKEEENSSVEKSSQDTPQQSPDNDEQKDTKKSRFSLGKIWPFNNKSQIKKEPLKESSQ